MWESGPELFALCTMLGGPVPWAMAAGRWADPDGSRGRTHRGLASLVTWLSLQAAAVVTLGALGWLNAGAGSVLALVAFATGMLQLRRLPRSTALPRPHEGLVWLSVACAGLCAVLAWELSSRPPVEWDTLAYHLPQLVLWLQHESLAPRLVHLTDRQIPAYPFGWEAVATAFVLPTGNDTLVAIPNLLAWSLYGGATYGLARLLGARAPGASLAVLLLLTLPIVTDALPTLQVDLAFGAFFVAALYFALRYAAERRPAPLAFCGASLLCLLWLKMSALVYVALVVVALAIACWRERSAHRPPPHPWSPRDALAVAGLALVAAVPVLFFYGRNWLLLGNPLGQLEVPGLWEGDPHFSEYVRRTSLARLFDWRSPEDLAVLRQVVREHLGWRGALLGLAALASLASRRGPRRAGVWLLLAASLVLYWTTPYSGDNGAHGGRITPWIGQGLRYGFPGLAMLTVLASLGLGWVGERFAFAGAFVLVALAALPESAPPAAAWGIGVAAWGAMLLARSRNVSLWSRMGRIPPAVLVAAAALALLLLSVAAHTPRLEARRRAYGPVVAHLDENALPGAEVVVFTGTQVNRVYGLYGPGLDRRLRHVPSDRPDALEELASRKIRWLVVANRPALLRAARARVGQARVVAKDKRFRWQLFDLSAPPYPSERGR